MPGRPPPPSRPARPIAAVRLDGGRLCLDFVNTIHDRHAAEPEDYVGDAGRLLQWSLRAGALRPGEAVTPPASAAGRAALVGEARALRAHLHALMAARIDAAAPPDEAVRGLDRWLHRAWAGRVLGPDGRLHWRPKAMDARLPLKRIALDAVELLADPSPGRLRRCANTASCGWLFLDTSKNRRRRWCAMQTCGTLEKMARYRGG